MSLGAIEIIVLVVVVFVVAGWIRRRPGREHRSGVRLFVLGCSTVLFGALAGVLLLAVIVAFRVKHVVDRRVPHPSPPMEVGAPSTLAASVLELRLIPRLCRQRELKPSEIATALLVLVNEATTADAADGAARSRHGKEPWRAWERTEVRSRGRHPLTIADIARLSRRHPMGARRAPIQAIVMRVDRSGFAPDSFSYAQLLIDSAQELLTSVATSRTAATGMPSFRVAMDGSALVLWLPDAATATQSFVGAQIGESLVRSISAIEIELAARGWEDQFEKSARELAEKPIAAAHSVGEWLAAVYLAEAALDGILGAKSWPDDQPQVSVEPVNPPIEIPTVPTPPVANDPTPDLPPAPLVEAVEEVAVARNDAAKAPVVAAMATSPATSVGGSRPSWVDIPPEQRVGADGLYRLVGTTGPLSATPQQSQIDADVVVHELFNQYTRRLYGDELVGKLRLPREINASKVVTWTEASELPTTGMTMYETHVMLALDEHDRQLIEERLQSLEIDRRVHLAGGGATLVLGLIATLWGYLRLDTASRGYYSGRLKLGAAAAAALVAGAAVHIARG